MFPVTFNVPDVKTTKASLLSFPPELVKYKLLQLKRPRIQGNTFCDIIGSVVYIYIAGNV